MIGGKYTIIREKYTIISWKITIFYSKVYDLETFWFSLHWNYTIIIAESIRWSYAFSFMIVCFKRNDRIVSNLRIASSPYLKALDLHFFRNWKFQNFSLKIKEGAEIFKMFNRINHDMSGSLRQPGRSFRLRIPSDLIKRSAGAISSLDPY